MERPGVITGLLSEAECLTELPADRRPSVTCAGIGAERARTAARTLLSEGCDGLVSFGVAGGLDPALMPGSVVIADGVTAPDGGRILTDTAWADGLARNLASGLAVTRAPIAGSDTVLASTAGKRELRDSTGAAAVDMESQGIGQVAAAAGIPFLAVRAIADPAARAIPPWLLTCVTEDGGLRPAAVIAPLLARPWKVWALIGLARENGKALGSLRRVASLGGPRLGFG